MFSATVLEKVELIKILKNIEVDKFDGHHILNQGKKRHYFVKINAFGVRLFPKGELLKNNFKHFSNHIV